jgi:uncharacterized membrane protein
MNKKRRIVPVFILSFIVTFLIVRCLHNPTHLRFDHARNLTALEHFKTHLILTLAYDVKPAIIIAIIITIIFSAIVYFRDKRRAKKEYKGRGVL